MTIASVNLWGRRIGAVVWDQEARLASFEYEPRFRRSGIQVSPITMPLSDRIYQFSELTGLSFRGLPGLLADSLPDRYGDALIDAWLARQGRDSRSFDPVERLCYAGRRAVGALEYQPETGPVGDSEDLDVAELVALADAILSKRTDLNEASLVDTDAINRILQVGTSAGGARAKAVIAWDRETNAVRSGQVDLDAGFEHWILKFDGVAAVDDREVGTAKGYGLIEHAYALTARAAGIDIAETRVLPEGGRNHFMTRRFDRTADGGKIHMQSLAALAHFDYNDAGAHSYEQAIECMRRLGLSQAEIEQQFRRAVFNVVARIQDDHVKNIAFLMDKEGNWRLSPAFDVTYSYNPSGDWTARHQMSLGDKRDGFVLEDLLGFGRFCNLKTPRSKKIIGEVSDAVADWRSRAREVGVDEEKAEEIQRHLRLDF